MTRRTQQIVSMSHARTPRALVLLLAGAATFTLSQQAEGQVGHVGVIAGAAFSSLRGIDGLDSRTGLIGGLSLVLPSRGLLTLQPELLFSSKGAKGSTTSATGLQLDYVEVPVLLRLTLAREGTVHPHLYAGPYLGLEIDCSVSGSAGDCEDLPGVSTKTVDVGGTAGGGLDVDFGPLVLTGGMRYSFGVSKVADFTRSAARAAARNGSFALYIGAGLRLPGGR